MFPGNVHPGLFPEIARKFPGIGPEMSRKSPGLFPETARKCPANTQTTVEVVALEVARPSRSTVQVVTPSSIRYHS